VAEPIVTLERDYASLEFDPYRIEENRASAERRLKQIPAHFALAKVTHPEIVQWVKRVVASAVETSGPIVVSVTAGPSLLLLGPTGTGKTFEAYGALRALSESGVSCAWTATTAADMYARLRPRHRVDSEEEFERYLKARVLMIDDLGAAKASEFTEEVNYRLINHRYEHELPTLITSNVLPRDLAASLGERVASRLTEMADRVVLKGTDRRRERPVYDPDERLEPRRVPGD
jgi:DNA replication protein DnaC